MSFTDFNYYKAAWFPPPDIKQNNDHVSLYLHLLQQPGRRPSTYLATESKQILFKRPESIFTGLFFILAAWGQVFSCMYSWVSVATLMNLLLHKSDHTIQSYNIMSAKHGGSLRITLLPRRYFCHREERSHCWLTLYIFLFFFILQVSYCYSLFFLALLPEL